MTEQEWLTTQTECYKMLNYIKGKISNRKNGLITCAFLKYVYNLDIPVNKNFINNLEKLVEKNLRLDYIVKNMTENLDIHNSQKKNRNERTVTKYCNIIRDIVGNPFAPIYIDRTKLTPDILSISQHIYDNTTALCEQFDPNSIKILADAVEEAGLYALLPHLRSKQPHMKGCFVIDLILNKE